MASQKQGDATSEHFFIAMNVASFTDFDEYAAAIDQGIRTIQAAKPVEGVDQVYLPGEIEWRKREAWVGSGIPLHIDHLRDLANLAEELKVDICWEW